MKPARIRKFGETWVQEDAYDAMEAIVEELSESDPWISGESSLWCHHCKAQKLHGVDYVNEQHKPDCLRLRAKALISE